MSAAEEPIGHASEVKMALRAASAALEAVGFEHIKTERPEKTGDILGIAASYRGKRYEFSFVWPAEENIRASILKAFARGTANATRDIPATPGGSGVKRAALRGFVLAGAIVALATCATPGPTPTPVTPAAPFTCAGPASVPGFDDIANELVNAAQVEDDASAFAALDAVAGVHGLAVVLCVVGEILPDLRAAPVTSIHMQAWQAKHMVQA